jgi:hypothetical protein
MARPRIADEEHSLQIWRLATNILNTQSQTADKRCSSSLGLGEGLTTHRKKPACYEILQRRHLLYILKFSFSNALT